MKGLCACVRIVEVIIEVEGAAGTLWSSSVLNILHCRYVRSVMCISTALELSLYLYCCLSMQVLSMQHCAMKRS